MRKKRKKRNRYEENGVRPGSRRRATYLT